MSVQIGKQTISLENYAGSNLKIDYISKEGVLGKFNYNNRVKEKRDKFIEILKNCPLNDKWMEEYGLRNFSIHSVIYNHLLPYGIGVALDLTFDSKKTGECTITPYENNLLIDNIYIDEE